MGRARASNSLLEGEISVTVLMNGVDVSESLVSVRRMPGALKKTIGDQVGCRRSHRVGVSIFFERESRAVSVPGASLT